MLLSFDKISVFPIPLKFSSYHLVALTPIHIGFSSSFDHYRHLTMGLLSKSAFEISSSTPFDCLLFDLDDTLYSSKSGIGAALKKNIEDFLVEKFGYSNEKASSVRVELFKTHGSTLAGLRALGYDIEADDYHSVVHGRLPYDTIKPNIQLRNLLESISQRKLIFTNSDKNHTTKVLERLGLEDCFEQIICFESMNPNLAKSSRPDEFPVVLKPSIDAMQIAINIAKVDPYSTLFLDDNVRNITAGKAVGLQTVLVGKAMKSNGADYAVENIVNLKQVVPEIWFAADQQDEDGSNNNGRSDEQGGDDHQSSRMTRDTRTNEMESMATPTPVGA